MTLGWIPSSEIGLIAELKRQSLQEAIERTKKNPLYLWRGARLIVRERHGRGGRSGKQYEVRVDSLPVALQEALKARRAAAQAPLKDDDAARAERDFRWTVIAPAMEHPARSSARVKAVEAIAAVAHHHPVTGRRRYSVRTLQRWIDAYESLGLGAVQKRRRSDAGVAKVFVSALWDRSVPFDEEVKAAIAAVVRQDLRNLWGNGLAYSGVRREASTALAQVTAAKGFDPGRAALARICLLPKNVVESERSARRVHEYLTDRKAWNDRRPRIRRSTEGLEPMQCVMADIHHLDVLVERPDGSSATPKLIAWMDVATHRMRGDLVFCEPGRMVRNADVIESFRNMVADPAWGLPAGLYVDNGSEFNFADFLQDAMRLHSYGLRVGAPDLAPVTRSTPYEAASKGLIEGNFRILEQQCLAAVQGYIGGERMKSKSANLGRPQEPFSGGHDAFRKILDGLLAWLNTNPRRNTLNGRSPDGVFQAWITDRNWQRVDFDVDELAMVFAKTETRKITRGEISVALPDRPSQPFRHDRFVDHEGEVVTVYLPKFLSWHGIPVYTLKGERIGIATPSEVHPWNASSGPSLARHLKTTAVRSIREQAKTVQKIDVPSRMAATAAASAGTAQATRAAIVSVGDHLRADAREQCPEVRRQMISAQRQRDQDELRKSLARYRKPDEAPR